MKYVPHAAALAISLVMVVAYLAFPREVTVTRTVKVDPYRSFELAQVATEPINGEFTSRCEFLENRDGITQGSSPPQEGDTIVVVCRAIPNTGSS